MAAQGAAERRKPRSGTLGSRDIDPSPKHEPVSNVFILRIDHQCFRIIADRGLQQTFGTDQEIGKPSSIAPPARSSYAPRYFARGPLQGRR